MILKEQLLVDWAFMYKMRAEQRESKRWIGREEVVPVTTKMKRIYIPGECFFSQQTSVEFCQIIAAILRKISTVSYFYF